MSTFNLTGASAPNPLPRWLPPLGGLLAAAVTAAFVSRLPVVHALSMADLIGSAFAQVLAVFSASAVTVWGLCALRAGMSGRDTRSLVLRASIGALWLAPLALFLRENSAWAMAMAAVLVATVVTLLRRLEARRADPDEPENSSADREIFSLPESSHWLRRQVFAAAAALCAQTGAVAGFAGFSLTGALLVAISTAAWTHEFTTNALSDTLQSSAPPRSNSRVLLAFAIVIFFTAAGLIPFLRNTYQVGGFGIPSTRHSTHHLTRIAHGKPGTDQPSKGADQSGQHGEKSSDGGDQSEPTRHDNAFEGTFAAAKDENTGIILWPKKQLLTKLVAPAPVLGNSLLTSHRAADPLVIPFNGVYWVFKSPDAHPPDTSRQAQGSPEALDIHSTDRRPLSMEAHEHFGSMIDVNCCSRIQIAIRNADPYPQAVSLELILVNSSLPGKPSQSLGTITVKSTRAWKIYETPPPAVETLNFPIPSDHSLRRFDEVKIVYRLEAFRADDGARIAIDHFVLVPRGL